MSASKLVAALLVVITGLSLALLRQPSVVVSQSVPLEKRIAALETRVYALEQAGATALPLADVQIVEIGTPGDLLVEAVLIVNNSDDAVNLKGWQLEREGGPAYTFGDFQMFSGSAVWIYTGDGTDTTVALHWKQSSPVWTDGSIARLVDSKGVVVFTYETPAATATPKPATVAKDTPASTGIDYEIVSINSKVTESNAVWERNSWIVSIKNNGPQTLIFDLTIEFLDEDGFILNEAKEYDLVLEPYETTDYTGFSLLNLEQSRNTTNVNAKTHVTNHD